MKPNLESEYDELNLLGAVIPRDELRLIQTLDQSVRFAHENPRKSWELVTELGKHQLARVSGEQPDQDAP